MFVYKFHSSQEFTKEFAEIIALLFSSKKKKQQRAKRSTEI